MKQNVLLSMLAMTVPMAAFADANVPTAKMYILLPVDL